MTDLADVRMVPTTSHAVGRIKKGSVVGERDLENEGLEESWKID